MLASIKMCGAYLAAQLRQHSLLLFGVGVDLEQVAEGCDGAILSL